MKRWYFLPVGAILALVMTFLPAQTASAAEVCGQWDTVPVLGGEYTIQNNVWGATTAQCINVPSTSSTAWSVTSSSHNQGSVAAYPSIYKGCHFGDCTTNSGMPILVSQVTTAPFSWNVTRVSSGVWNIAAEAWFSPITDSTNGYNGGAELMIWLDYMGMQPSGSRVGTASIGGATWEVWYSNIGWNYIAYRRVGAASSISADLKSFINDAVSRGYIQPSWYLHDFEAGTELMTGGAGFASNAFSFAVNTGTPPPTTPPPTTPPPTTPPPTTPPPTTPPPTTPPPGVCQVAYTMNQWSNGFTADVKITNNGSSAIQGWTLTWSFANGQKVTSAWNATVTQSGSTVTASNPASYWNGTIGANGGSVSFGFQATHTGTNNIPTSFTLNGVACNGGTPPPTTPPPTTPPPTTPPPTTPPPTTPPPTTPPPTTPPPTTPPPTTPPPTTTVPGGCSVRYVNQNDWGSGATINVTITNGSSSNINGWTLTWTFPGNQQISNLWNGSFSQSGASVSVSDAGWNGTITANGGTAGFGFNLSYSGANATPAGFRLNGAACQ